MHFLLPYNHIIKWCAAICIVWSFIKVVSPTRYLFLYLCHQIIIIINEHFKCIFQYCCSIYFRSGWSEPQTTPKLEFCCHSFRKGSIQSGEDLRNSHTFILNTVVCRLWPIGYLITENFGGIHCVIGFGFSTHTILDWTDHRCLWNWSTKDNDVHFIIMSVMKTLSIVFCGNQCCNPETHPLILCPFSF